MGDKQTVAKISKEHDDDTKGKTLQMWSRALSQEGTAEPNRTQQKRNLFSSVLVQVVQCKIGRIAPRLFQTSVDSKGQLNSIWWYVASEADRNGTYEAVELT